jgi:hypothetical protein
LTVGSEVRAAAVAAGGDEEAEAFAVPADDTKAGALLI